MSAADGLTGRLLAFVAERGLRPGDRLPGERSLASEMGVSRSSLREAISRLAAGGRLATRPGGGTFVQAGGVRTGSIPAGEVPADGVRGNGALAGGESPLPAWSDGAIAGPLAPLLLRDPEYRYDVLEIRQSLEGAAARHAALRATVEDRAALKAAFAATLGPFGHAAGEARADASFHLAIAKASHNVVLFQVLRGMFDLLEASTTRNLERLYRLPRIAEPLEAQHRALMEAVVAGDADAAEAASDRHLAFVRQALKSLDEDAARHARALHMPAPPRGAMPAA